MSDVKVGEVSGMPRGVVERVRVKMLGVSRAAGTHEKDDMLFTPEEMARLDRWLVEHGA
jgi:hypothetical protein